MFPFSRLRSSDPRPAARTSLSVERLDDRLVPAVLGSTIVADAGVLRFWDDGGDTAIVIEDNGTYQTDNIRIKVYEKGAYDAWQALGGQVGTEPVQSASATELAKVMRGKSFWQIQIDDRGGSDKVVYNLPTGLRDAVYHEIHARLDSPLGGTGNDEFKATVNGMGAKAGARVIVDGGRGDDRIEVEAHGTLRAGASLGAGLEGGYGRDDVLIDAWDSVVVERTAVIWANLSGFYYNRMTEPDLEDTVAVWYLGRMDGNLQYNLFGGNRGDNLVVNIWANAGRTGSVGVSGSESARAQGGDGHDHIYYYVRGGDLTWHQPTADGGSGTDTFHRIGNGGESWSFYRAITRDDGDGSRELDPNRVRRMDRFQFD